MGCRLSHQFCRRGFSLLELAIVLVITGLVAGLALKVTQSGNTGTECYASTQNQLETIRTAVDQFVIKSDRLPMPAVRTAGVEDITYGREAALGSLDLSGAVVYGALPFQALGLAPSYAGDCWGNKFTYAVTRALTSSAASGGYRDPTVLGAITVKSTTATNLMTDAAYAVISHGANALGAVKINYTDASNTLRKWCGVTSAIESENCDVGNAIVAAAEFNDGTAVATDTFDDVECSRAR